MQRVLQIGSKILLKKYLQGIIYRNTCVDYGYSFHLPGSERIKLPTSMVFYQRVLASNGSNNRTYNWRYM